MRSSDKHPIRFLGTGASDWLLPHECSDTCRDRCDRVERLGGRNVRRASSLWIGPDLVVDFTSQTVEALDAFSIDRASIRAILITHGHYDHFQPTPLLKFAAALPHPLTVCATQTVSDALQFAAAHEWDPSRQRFVLTQDGPLAAGLRNIEMNVVSPGTTVNVGEFTCTAVLANHMVDKRHLILEQQALNFVIELGGRALFYGLDSSYVLPETFELLSRWRFAAAVFDATFGYLEIDPYKSGHHNFAMLDDTIMQFRQAGLFEEDAVIAATHLSRAHVDPHDEISDQLAERGILLAYDGLTLEL